MTTIVETTETAPVTAPELCDRCGGQTVAAVLVKLPSGNVLTFCMHHGTDYLPTLPAGSELSYL